MLEKSLSQRLSARIELQGYDSVGSYSVYRVKGSASVEREYAYDIEFISDSEIAIAELNDTKGKLTIKDENELFVKKQVYGLIYEAKEYGSIAKKRLYKIRLVSPLFYLGLNKRYEVFMDVSVPSIVSSIISRYASLLHLEIGTDTVDPKAYPVRHYTTQYAQSDLDFIKMLLQEEGLVLLLDESSDDPFKITLCQLNEHAPFLEQKLECSYNKQKSFLPSMQLQDYYDSNRPSFDMQTINDTDIVQPSFKDNGATKQLRQEFKKERLRDRIELLENSLSKDLTRYSIIDAQQEHSKALIISGKTKDLQAKEGICVKLYDPKVDKEDEVIITSVTYGGYFPNALDEHIEDTTKESTQYEVEFNAIAKDIVYRPNTTTDKPKIHGVQTAIVSCGEKDTSKDVNEIDVNEKGEIRVIFHFDKNRPTSCYIPLATSFAGDNYGTQFLPRVNSEVIVSFINGDIDKPVIIGSLHNGENKHPYNLPKDKTKSFIKTYTTPQYEDKQGYNELLFEDKAGDERLALRAQKDYELHTLHDANIHIEHDKKTIIDNNEDHTVAKNYTQTVGEDATTQIAGNDIKVVEKEQITTINEDRQTHLNKNDITITKENKQEIVEKDLIQRIKGYVTTYREKDVKEKYLESLYTDVTKELGIRVHAAFHLQANSIKENASGTIELESPNGISLKCGRNVLTVDGSGIHFKTPNFDDNSTGSGVVAKEVDKMLLKYDQKFQLRDSFNNQPLPKQRYKVTASSGEAIEGVTDSEGYTQRIATSDFSTLNIELLE
jgi:type VI secretion system secreted protein VgrG